MARTLKVYGWRGHRAEAPGYHHQTREIIAAYSAAEVGRIVGIPPRTLDLCETGNRFEIATATARPGIVFWQALHATISDPFIADEPFDPFGSP